MNTRDAKQEPNSGRTGGQASTMPVITVTRGCPTDAELAALLCVLPAALAVPEQPSAAPRPSRWADRSRLADRLRPGQDSWRASALPY